VSRPDRKPLTRHEREVITDAMSRADGRVYAQDWERAARKIGGRGSGGGRLRHQAIRSLVDRGYLDRYHATHSNGCLPLGDITVYSTDAVAYLTDEGYRLGAFLIGRTMEYVPGPTGQDDPGATDAPE
jgi:hypothetical protein